MAIYKGTDLIAGTLLNVANKDLSNLSAIGEDRLHALKGYLDEGELLTDAEGLADVKAYKLSGTTTAIDTVKTDDYTVVGSPTISNDGVASGFSASNYLTENSIDFSNMNSFKLNIDFTISNTTHTKSREIFQLYDGTNAEALAIFQHTSDNRIFLCYPTSSSTSTNAVIGTALSVGQHSLILDYDGTNAYIYIDGTLKLTQAITKSYIQKIYTLYIGTSDSSSHTLYFTGSIDLNAFKIYVDGDLVYQPCLKIPYTLSKTGSKIVDVAYRPRVVDMYNQFGSAPYYTLDETNNNFTIPMGELYGMKVDKAELTEAAVVVESYENGKDGYIVYSNGVCEQWGTYYGTIGASAGHEITLLKAYKNTDYDVVATSSSPYYITGAYATSANTFIHLSRYYDDDLGGQTDTAYVCWRTIGYVA